MPSLSLTQNPQKLRQEQLASHRSLDNSSTSLDKELKGFESKIQGIFTHMDEDLLQIAPLDQWLEGCEYSYSQWKTLALLIISGTVPRALLFTYQHSSYRTPTYIYL